MYVCGSKAVISAEKAFASVIGLNQQSGEALNCILQLLRAAPKNWRNLQLSKFIAGTFRLRKSLARREEILSGKFPPRLEVLIVSAGGSGSTALIRHVSEYYTCNYPNDRDGLKHLPAPPPRDLAEKIIYLHGDIKDVKNSLRRRGLLLLQVLKLRPHSSAWKFGGSFNLEHLARLQMTRFSESLETPVLFVHYNNLFESAQTISDFLGHRDGFVSNFPVRQEREST